MQYICSIHRSKTAQCNMIHLLNTLQYFAQYAAVKLLGVLWRNCLTFRHRASCILGQAFHYSPENAFYIFN